MRGSAGLSSKKPNSFGRAGVKPAPTSGRLFGILEGGLCLSQMKTLYALRYDTVWGRLNVETLVTQFVEWLPKLLSAIGILVVFWVIWRFLRPFLTRILSRARLDHAL